MTPTKRRTQTTKTKKKKAIGTCTRLLIPLQDTVDMPATLSKAIALRGRHPSSIFTMWSGIFQGQGKQLPKTDMVILLLAGISQAFLFHSGTSQPCLYTRLVALVRDRGG
jgi:hypothetical protein